MYNFRVGHGYDVHRLVEGRKMIIGGVEIPHDRGLLGHSDADVLLHAIMDSIIGALALGDIGKHFPDTDEKLEGISSINLLTQVSELVKQHNAEIINIDSVVILQRPKIAIYIDKMISNISFALGIPADRINVKATTEEKLGFTGSEDGVSAHAVVLLSRK